MSLPLAATRQGMHLSRVAHLMPLVTCQRIEFYASAPLDYDPVERYVGVKGLAIRGRPTVFRRLVEIASGARSQLLGETFIEGQLEKAVSDLPPSSPLYSLGQGALQQARQLRDKYGFYARCDHQQIVLSFFLDRAAASQDHVARLVIIGSGMIARAVAEAASKAGYAQIVLISRSAKKLRQRRIFDGIGREIYSFDTLPAGFLDQAPYHCLVATENSDAAYCARIVDACYAAACRAVVDMSSIPILDGVSQSDRPIMTMHSQSYLDYIDKNNSELSFTRIMLLQEIEMCLGA
jgi:hypothetical protein